MKKNKTFKILLIFLIFILITMFLSHNVLAFPNMSIFDNTQADHSNATNKVASTLGATIDVVRTVGTGIAIILLIQIAIKFIHASPEGRAEVKKISTYYIVGAVILFSASGLLTIAQRFIYKNIRDV